MIIIILNVPWPFGAEPAFLAPILCEADYIELLDFTNWIIDVAVDDASRYLPFQGRKLR
jgi:hypothetical protein